MNILLTNRCNRNCPYCFAKERVSLEGTDDQQSAPLNISRDDFSDAIEFAVKSNLREVGILGGEPSMHPAFIDLLKLAWEKKIATKVFTNGLWAQQWIDEMPELHRQYGAQMKFIVNMNEPERSPEGEHTRQSVLFRAVPKACSLSFNISRTDFDGGFLIDTIKKYGIKPDIRLGVAQPLAALPNEHVVVADYHQMAPSIMNLAQTCDQHDVRFGFDCGFTLCMFTEEQIGQLILAGARFKSSCGPAVDIGTDLSVWACFPLSTFSTTVYLSDFAFHKDLTQYFEEKFGQLYTAGALDECADCKYRHRKQCNAGCAAHVYRSFNP